MEVTSIEFLGNDGWQSYTEFNYTPSAQLHIPSVGDIIKNRMCKRYKVVEVEWNLPTNSIIIDCELISE